MFHFLFSLALASSSLSLDLDGDGKAETIRHDAEAGVVWIGSHKIPCAGDPCDLEAHDVSSANKNREVEVCEQGIRDEVLCTLYTIDKGALKKYIYPEEWRPSELRTAGNGLILAVDSYHFRLFEKIQKFRVQDYKMVEVKQPIYTATTRVNLKIDRTFPLYLSPTGKQVVANTRPNSTVQILGEHGEHAGWLLIRLSSGISGWAKRDALERVSTDYMRTMGAG